MATIRLVLLLLPALVLAQGYSRWNYKDSKPNDVTADAKLIADFQAAIDNHATGELRIFKAYRYLSVTDSSFEMPDINDRIMRVFDPTPAPDGATELTREDTVVVLSKHSPLVKTVLVGGDGILPKGQTIRPLSTFLAWAARKEAVALRKAVDDSIKAKPSSGNTNTSPTWAGNSFAATEANWYNTGMYTKWAGGAATGFTMGTGGRDSVMTSAKSQYFGTTTGADSLCKALALGPTSSSSANYGNDYYYANNNGTSFPLRSGRWSVGTNAGVFVLHLGYARTSTYDNLGFRAALVE